MLLVTSSASLPHESATNPTPPRTEGLDYFVAELNHILEDVHSLSQTCDYLSEEALKTVRHLYAEQSRLVAWARMSTGLNQFHLNLVCLLAANVVKFLCQAQETILANRRARGMGLPQ